MTQVFSPEEGELILEAVAAKLAERDEWSDIFEADSARREIAGRGPCLEDLDLGTIAEIFTARFSDAILAD